MHIAIMSYFNIYYYCNHQSISFLILHDNKEPAVCIINSMVNMGKTKFFKSLENSESWAHNKRSDLAPVVFVFKTDICILEYLIY